MKYEDTIMCTEDVVMDDGRIAFTKGKLYKTNLQALYLAAKNDQKQIHGLGKRYSEDRWFSKHFRVIREVSV